MQNISNIFIIFKNFFQLLIEKNNFFSNKENVDFFCKQIISLGPLYIKFCQLLSQKTNLLNDNIYLKEKISNFQERCPFHSYTDTKKIFKENFNSDIDSFFFYFNPKPLFSGSISQIYECKMDNDGELLIMKIKHPNIEKQLKENIYQFKILSKLLKLAGFTFLDLIDLDNFYQQLLDQTDFTQEANFIKELNQIYKDHKFVKIPELKTYSEDIIIESFIPGTKYNYSYFRGKKLDLKCKIKATVYFLEMIFVYKMSHLDCHNGNILYDINDENNLSIGFIDFGLFEKISSSDRDIIGNLIKSIHYKSTPLLINSLIKSCQEPIDYYRLLNILKSKDISYFFSLKKNDQSFIFIKELLVRLSNNNVKIKNEILNIVINLSLILESIDDEYELKLPIFDYVVYEIIENSNLYNKLSDTFNMIINPPDYNEKKKIISSFYKFFI